MPEVAGGGSTTTVLMVTVTVLMVWLPAASFAVEEILWMPLPAVLVFQVKLDDEPEDEATTIPSMLMFSELTPTLSDADALIERVVFASYAAPFVGDDILTDGAVISPTVTLLTDTCIELELLLPFPSFAVTVKVCVPLSTVPEFQMVVNGAVVLLVLALPSTLSVTEVTLTLSVAETVTLTVPETVLPFAGDKRLITGATLSGLPLAAILEIGMFSINAPDCKKPEETITGTLACRAESSSTMPPLRV